jgi:tetratricopeptide (TPR) repeat protein
MKRIVLVAVALTLAAPHALRAQEKEKEKEDPAKVEEARRFFDAGRQAYESGQYLVAITAFEEALRLSPRPPVVFSAAQAYRRQYFVDHDPAKLKRAVDLYKQYIVDVPNGGRRDDAVQYVAELEPVLTRIEDEQKKKGMGPVQAMQMPKETTQLMISSRTKEARASIDGGDMVEVPLIRDVKSGKHKIHVEAPGYFPEDVDGTAVEGRLVAVEVPLREMPATLAITTASGADVSVDGRPVGSTPFSRPVEIPAGKHLVMISKRGHYPVTREITVKRGETAKLDAKLDRTTQRKASYFVLGGGGALFVAGGVTATLAFVHQGRAEDAHDKLGAPGATQEDLDRFNSELASRNGYRNASYYLFGGAGVLAATGLLLFFVDSPRAQAPIGELGGDQGPETPPPADPSNAVMPMAGADGFGLVYTGTF